MFVKERLCVVIPACFGWIQFYIFTFCLICFVDFSWFFYIWSPFWCCPAGNISRLKEFYIRRLSQNDGVAPAMARLRQSRSPRSNFGSPRTSPRQTPRCQLGCYDLHVGKKRFANMFPAMLIYVVSYCNCLSHFHSFSPLSQKCPPQQWREREREQQEHVDRLQCCASRTHGFNIGSSGAAACRNSEVESPESIYEKYVTGKVLLSSSLGRMGRAANYTTEEGHILKSVGAIFFHLFPRISAYHLRPCFAKLGSEQALADWTIDPPRGASFWDSCCLWLCSWDRERERPRAESSTEQFLSCMCTSVSWQTAEQNMQIRLRCLMSRPACQRGHHQWEIQTGSGA